VIGLYAATSADIIGIVGENVAMNYFFFFFFFFFFSSSSSSFSSSFLDGLGSLGCVQSELGQLSMLQMGFEHMIPVFERKKTFLALHRVPLQSEFGMISFRITNSMARKLKCMKLNDPALCAVAVRINEEQKCRLLIHGNQKISGNM
jgi:hypothetical protein